MTSKSGSKRTANWGVCVQKRTKYDGNWRAMKEIYRIARMLKITKITGWDNCGMNVILQGVWLKLIVHEVFLAGLCVQISKILKVFSTCCSHRCVLEKKDKGGKALATHASIWTMGSTQLHKYGFLEAQFKAIIPENFTTVFVFSVFS